MLMCQLFSYSKGSIAMNYNPVMRSASKHVDISDHYARELVETGSIIISYVSTTDMIADALTKPLGRQAHARHASKLIEKIG